MSVAAEDLPEQLRALAPALDWLRTRATSLGFRADHPCAPLHEAGTHRQPGPEYEAGLHWDGARGGATVCLRLALDAGAVNPALAAHLRAGQPAWLGDDDALYVFASDSRSEMVNRRAAVARLVAAVAAAEPSGP